MPQRARASASRWRFGRFAARLAARCALPAIVLFLGACALTPREARTRIDRLVTVALDEWRDWGRQMVRFTDDGGLCALLADGTCRTVDDGCGRERSSRYCALVNRYWPLVSAYRHPCDPLDRCEATLPAGASAPRTEPWSAAFVSHLYRASGFSRNEFLFSDTHADYVLAAREGRMPEFEVVVVPLAPRRGDLLCSVRGPARAIGPPMVDWISAQWTARPFTPMHCDLVVEVSSELRVARIVGGNVEQAVSMREARLDANGRLDWSPPPAPGWLLVLRLTSASANFGESGR